MKNETNTNVNVEDAVKTALRDEKKKKGKMKLIILGAIVIVVAIVIASISISNNAKDPDVEIMGMYVDESYDDESTYALYVLLKMIPNEEQNLILSNSSVEISVNGNKYQDSYIDYTNKAIDEGCYDHNIYRVLGLLKFEQLPKEIDEGQEIFAGDTTPRYYATKFIVSKSDVDNAGKLKLEFYPCYAIDTLDVCVNLKADMADVVFAENADEMGKHVYDNIKGLADGAAYLTREERYDLFN